MGSGRPLGLVVARCCWHRVHISTVRRETPGEPASPSALALRRDGAVPAEPSLDPARREARLPNASPLLRRAVPSVASRLQSQPVGLGIGQRAVNEPGFGWCLIVDLSKFGRLDPAVAADAALERHVEDAAGELGTLDRIGGLPGAEEVLDAQHQGVEEAGAGRGGEVHQRRDDRWPAGRVVDPRGDRRVVNMAVQDQDRGAQAVDVFDQEGDGAGELGLDVAPGRARAGGSHGCSGGCRRG